MEEKQGVNNAGYYSEDSNSIRRGNSQDKETKNVGEASEPSDASLSTPDMDVLSPELVLQPFNIIAGSSKAPKSRFSPFRKKSGLLNVLARQAKVFYHVTRLSSTTEIRRIMLI